LINIIIEPDFDFLRLLTHLWRL